jgi:hypothetical protein
MIESPKIKAIKPDRPVYASSTRIDRWAGKVPADYQGATEIDFCNWALRNDVLLMPDCSFLANMNAVFSVFLEQWRYPDASNLEASGFVRFAKNLIKVKSFNSHTQVTIRNGNHYGRIIDCHEWLKAGVNLSNLADGFKAHGFRNLPAPYSSGHIAAYLMHGKTSCVMMPDRVLDLAWQACKGSRMEALSLGTCNGYAYDISSAFPYAASELLMCDRDLFCEWSESDHYQADADYGFARIKTHIPTDWATGPLAVRQKTGIKDDSFGDDCLRFPVGDVEAIVTKAELDLLLELAIPFQVVNGVWGYCKTSVRPFCGLMELLWELRNYDNAGAKMLSVACVGQLGSAIDIDKKSVQARGFWNPVYFAEIYARTRCEIFRKAFKLGLEHVKAFTIDGLITDKSMKTGDFGFGKWREESKGRFLILNDYSKDRGNGTEYREQVESTSVDKPESVFTTSFPVYVNPRSVSDRKYEMAQLGTEVMTSVDLPLGSSVGRKMPRSVKRADYLTQEIPTKAA